MVTPNNAASTFLGRMYRADGPNNQPLPASLCRWGLSRGMQAPLSLLTSQNVPPPVIP
jgi:hypothetical protein